MAQASLPVVRCRTAGILALAGLLSLQATLGQTSDLVTVENSTGVEAFNSYTGLRENVNIQNRNLNVVIPLFTIKGRNGLDIGAVSSYNAIQRQWVETERVGMPVCSYDPIPFSGSGRIEISIAPSLIFDLGLQADPDGVMDPDGPRLNRYLLREADGTRHEFRNATRDEDLLDAPTTAGAERFRSTGSSHMSLQEASGASPVEGNTDAEVFLRDGRRIYFERVAGYRLECIRDSNGNLVTFEQSAGIQTATDTLGREITLQQSGPATTVSYLDASGQAVEWLLEQDVPGPGQDTLTLPSGLQYVFTYGDTPDFFDPCGLGIARHDTRLVRIDYPAGGYVEYDWGVWPPSSPEKSVLVAVRRCERADGACTATEEAVWEYDQAVGGPVVTTRPDGSFSEHDFGRPGGSGLREEHELEARFYDAGGTLLRTVANSWEEFNRDPKVVEVVETLHVAGSPDQVRKTETDYDRNGYVIVANGTGFVEQASTGNALTVRESAWGDDAPGPLLRRTENLFLGGPSYDVHSSVHILDRLTRTKIFDGSGELGSQTDFFYDEYSTLNGFARALIGISAIQRDPGFGTGYTTRGNLSRRLDWLNTGADPVTLFRYDTAGNLRQVRDPNGNVSITAYSSATEFAYPSSATNPLGHVESFQYDYNAAFDRGLGLLTVRTDANGRTTSMSYDILGRVKQIDFPDGGVERRYYSDLEPSATHHQSGALVFPEQAQLPLRTKSYSLIASSPFLERESFEVADGLARLSLSGLRNGPDMDWTQTLYDGNERVSQVSNPLSLAYGSGGVPTPGFVSWTTTRYDALDRVIEVETPDGRSFVTAYSGNQTTVTDQVGAARRSTADALGRIIQVREPDPATGTLDSGAFSDTLYSYDLLDNLTGVLQGLEGSDQDGSGADGITQSRSFRYDTLGRLLRESHPESGTTRYAYDANGNLVEKVDARGRKTDNDYDALNRVISTSYSVEGDPSRSDPTPPVSYLYDGSTSLNRKGRLRSVTDGAGSSTFEYDSMGRTSHSVRTTRGKTLIADYTYTLLGGVKTATYQGISAPSFSLSYGYDSQGRQSSLTDGFNTYVSSYSFDYQAQGATERTFYGNGTQERISYNDRLQPVGRSVLNPSSQLLMDLGYSFADPVTSGNNGNVYAIDDLLNGQGRSFSYDKLNRLSGVAGAGWSIAYGYDRFGNRLSAVGTSSPPNFQNSILTVDPSTNRITSPGWEYDSAGNVIEDGGNHHLRWDAAGRLIEMGPPQPNSPDPPGDDGRCTGSGCPPPPPPPPDPDPPLDNGRSSGGFKSQSTGTVAYEYDYQDRRVVKDEGGSGRLYFWDEVLGEVIWEFPLENPSSQDLLRFFLNGRLVAENDARPGGGFHYFHRDHLGTSKLMTDFFSPSVACDEVYHPFGQLQSEQPSGCNAHVRKFTGKERDPESGLDYFGARYCDSVVGRFISVDPVLDSADLLDPQSWNRYAYVRNNPLRFVDPAGEDFFDLIEGIGNGIGSSLFFGRRLDASTRPTEFAIGQAIGDGASLVTGAVVTAIGLTGATGGTIATAGSFGLASPVSVPATVAGAGIAAAGGTVAVHSAANLGESTANLLNSVSASDGGGSLSKQAQKAIRTLEKRIAEHERKLEEFRRKPTVRPGMENQPSEVIKKQQQARIRKLEREIEVFKENIAKLRRGEL